MKIFICVVLTLLSSEALAEDTRVFKQTFSLQGISFDVVSKNQGSLIRLQIVPKGLSRDNKSIVREIEGSVTAAEIADLNADASPEIYIFVTSSGSGSYGSLVAYSANNKKSLSEVTLPDLTDLSANGTGYMGHDQFAVVENSLVRRFPIYRQGDTNSQPTGGIRQIEYKLHAGEAGWILKPTKTTDIK